MSQIGSSTTRWTNQSSISNLLSAIQETNRAINEAQQQISTGRMITDPSDDPSKVSLIQALQRQLEARAQHDRNLENAGAILNTADQSLADVTDILIEANNVALDQIGVGSDGETRDTMAAVLNSQIQALIEIANRQFGGIGLFSGAMPQGGQGFVDFLGGVRYVGGSDDLATDAGLVDALSMNVSGIDIFNLDSGTVVGWQDLDPQASADVSLADIDGALNQGVRLGSIVVTVNSVSVAVDLSDAKTLGDVQTRVNNAITTLSPTSGSLTISGSGFELTANPGNNIRIGESGQGKTAADLGIELFVDSATVAGADLNPALTELTALSTLGASIDWTSGLKITQGVVTKTADFSSAQTVQDLINILDQLGLGLKLQVNADGDGLDLVNQVSGLDLSVGENGGSTAEDLGIRTFSLNTRLADLNTGRGVGSVLGESDFQVALHDGSSFEVNIDGAVTVSQLIDAVADAATDAGLVVGVGGDFDIQLADDGNGLLLTDLTVGAEVFRVTDLGLSTAAADLGISGEADPSDTILGEDVAKVRVASVFTFLADLRDSLVNDDSRGIAIAQADIENAMDQLGGSRAQVALRAQRAERELERSAQVSITEESLLSDLQDADVTEVITRFMQLQTQLESSMQLASYSQQLSLLDFLR